MEKLFAAIGIVTVAVIFGLGLAQLIGIIVRYALGR